MIMILNISTKEWLPVALTRWDALNMQYWFAEDVSFYVGF
jgi:hypothetical protein